MIRPLTIAPWEFLVLIIYMIIVGVVFSRHKNIRIKKYPEYRYYIWGLYVKILGNLFFSLIYVYYYGNGDTISFFLSGIPLAELAFEDPLLYIQAIFADNSWENRYHFFSSSTGYPMGYVYIDSRSYMLVRMISPLIILCMQSYLLTGAVVSTIAFGGVWRLYRMFVRYYPDLKWQLAVAILFFPSAVFWGSGILKDTFTFTAMCWYISSMDAIFFLKKDRRSAWASAALCAFIMISMKPYVFMMVFPATLLWILYHRVGSIKNVLFRLLFLPMAFLLLGGLTIFTLQSLGDRLNKFSLDKALETVVISQQDMKRSEQYGENYVDLGEIEATWASLLSKFPQATFVGLFRPALSEANNVVMLFSALENAWLLLFFLWILIRSRIFHFITLIRTNPLLQMCFVFAIGYAFMIGITTPNFGAMVRFKIPLLPLFVSGMFITSYILDRRRETISRGDKFRFEWFTNGDQRSGVEQPSRLDHAASIAHRSWRNRSGLK